MAVFKNGQKVFGLLFMKICHRELSKIGQSVHTDYYRFKLAQTTSEVLYDYVVIMLWHATD